MESLSQKIDILILMRERELNFKSFIMGFHEYRKIWELKSDEILEVKLEPTNKKEKFPVAVIKNKKVIGHLPLDKTGRFSKTIFYFFDGNTINAKLKS